MAWPSRGTRMSLREERMNQLKMHRQCGRTVHCLTVHCQTVHCLTVHCQTVHRQTVHRQRVHCQRVQRMHAALAAT